MNNNTDRTRPTELTPLERILKAMNKAGGFRFSMLTSAEGLPIATVPADYESDLAAATVALLQRIIDDAQNKLRMGEIDEVSIRDRDQLRLVCRYVPTANESLILTTFAPASEYYRRATNQAIRKIQDLLS